jgi:hypothetical protein
VLVRFSWSQISNRPLDRARITFAATAFQSFILFAGVYLAKQKLCGNSYLYCTLQTFLVEG